MSKCRECIDNEYLILRFSKNVSLVKTILLTICIQDMFLKLINTDDSTLYFLFLSCDLMFRCSNMAINGTNLNFVPLIALYCPFYSWLHISLKGKTIGLWTKFIFCRMYIHLIFNFVYKMLDIYKYVEI